MEALFVNDVKKETLVQTKEPTEANEQIGTETPTSKNEDFEFDLEVN